MKSDENVVPEDFANADDLRLTARQSYDAMYDFLSNIYEECKMADLAMILSGLSTLEDGFPVDQAYWIEWQASVKRSLEGKINTTS